VLLEGLKLIEIINDLIGTNPRHSGFYHNSSTIYDVYIYIYICGGGEHVWRVESGEDYIFICLSCI
jgi:hypothetical protein